MADTTTTNLGLTKPEVGASADSWGSKLNTDLDLLDAVFAAAGTGTSVGLNVGSGKKLNISGQLIAAVDSASEAVRITQIGAGNALVIEDSANPDSSPFVVDADGFIIQGHTSKITTSAFQSNSGEPFSGIRWNAASSGPTLTLGKSRSGTIGVNAVVLNDDAIGAIAFTGDDGSAFRQAAAISAAVDGAPGQNAGTFTVGVSYRILTVGSTNFTAIGAASNTVGVVFTATGAGTGTGTAMLAVGEIPGRLIFSTTPDGGSNPAERMRITSGGRVGFGTTAPQTIVQVTGDVSNTDGIGFDQGQLVLTDTLETSALILGYRYEASVADYARIQARNAAGATNIALQAGGGNVGIGTATPVAKTEIYGTGQATLSSYSTSTNLGATLYVRDNGSAPNNGGAIMFGANQGAWGAIKGTLLDGASNTIGALSMYVRATTGASTLTEQVRLSADGTFSFNSGYGSVATAYGCRAWVNFHGGGTVAIRSSANVSSITDNGVGNYRVNFTNAMPDANYAVVGTASAGPNYPAWALATAHNVAPTTNGVTVYCGATGGSTIFGFNADSEYVSVSIFR